MIGRKKDVSDPWLNDYFQPNTELIRFNRSKYTHSYKKQNEICSINTILNQITTWTVLFVTEIHLRESTVFLFTQRVKNLFLSVALYKKY